MLCKRCQQLPDFEETNIMVYVHIPTYHHEPEFERFLQEEGFIYTKTGQYFVVEVTSLKPFIDRLSSLFNVVERNDIKLLPFNKRKGLSLSDLKNMRSLEGWQAFYDAKQIRYVLMHEAVNVHYQPIIELSSGRVIAHEALIRGRYHDGTDINPGVLFGQAKTTDLLFNLDKMCREVIIKDAADQKLEGKLFINFIPTSIYNPEHCLKTTLNAINTHNFNAEQVAFEVVETERIKNYDHLNTILDYYKEKGFMRVLDDVGSGYMDLETIKRLQPDIIKIDQTIIKDIHKHKSQQDKLNKYVDYCHKYNIKVLAEGVETKAEYDYVKALGLAYAQGYYIARPQPKPFTLRKALI